MGAQRREIFQNAEAATTNVLPCSKAYQSGTYKRHEPEKTLLYQVVQENLATFLAQCEASERTVPSFVKKEPVYYNTRIYSCILLDNTISERWRVLEWDGKPAPFNEDLSDFVLSNFSEEEISTIKNLSKEIVEKITSL